MNQAPVEIMMHQAQARPGDVAFVFHDESWTYERVAIESERVARGMAARGVRSGDRVALHTMNRPEFIVAYFACFRLGAIAAPLRTAFKFAELSPRPGAINCRRNVQQGGAVARRASRFSGPTSAEVGEHGVVLAVPARVSSKQQSKRCQNCS